MGKKETTRMHWVEVVQPASSIKKSFPYKLFQCYFVPLYLL